jgi:uncharacterized protein YbjT (DUF2867 family)
MNTPTITVMGATGHTGSKIAQRLLKSGAKVRALGRSEYRLAALQDGGAEVRAGDVADSGFLSEAFRGADAMARTPPDYAARQAREGGAIASAVGDSGVRFVVALSSLGAHLAEAPGVSPGCVHRKHGCGVFQGSGFSSFAQPPSSRTSSTR